MYFSAKERNEGKENCLKDKDYENRRQILLVLKNFNNKYRRIFFKMSKKNCEFVFIKLSSNFFKLILLLPLLFFLVRFKNGLLYGNFFSVSFDRLFSYYFPKFALFFRSFSSHLTYISVASYGFWIFKF